MHLSIVKSASQVLVLLNGQVISSLKSNTNTRETEQLLKAILPTAAITTAVAVESHKDPSGFSLMRLRPASINLPHPAC